MKVLNFGSLNIDYVYNVDHILIGGETLSATDRNIYPGGKGLNQSVAFARAGADIWHAGAIGQADGAILRQALEQNGVHLNYLNMLSDQPSGHTFIQVDKNGQNCILVYGGSNVCQTRAHIDQTLSHFSAGDYLILQNEINEIPYIMEQAHARGMNIVLNPSPFDKKIESFPLEYVTIFMLNEIEAAHLVGFAGSALADLDLAGGKADAELLDSLVRAYPDSHIVMTVGSRGAYYAHREERVHHGIFDIQVVDTTAAGDTFTGYFVTEFSNNGDADQSLRMASAASTLAVSRPGASTSIPLKKEVEEFLASDG